MVVGGMRGSRGGGGMHGCWGMVAGEGMHGCWGGGASPRYDKIRSMSGRYASYWNAFLFKNKF